MKYFSKTHAARQVLALLGVVCVHAVLLGALILNRSTPVALPVPKTIEVALLSVALPAAATKVTTKPLTPPTPVQPEPVRAHKVAPARAVPAITKPLLADKSPDTSSKPSPVSAATESAIKTAANPATDTVVRPDANSPSTSTPVSATADSVEPAAVTLPVFNAAYLNNPAPAYPARARRNGETGKTLLRVHVNADGKADEVRVQNSSGFIALDEAALTAVRQWRFVPARQGELAVAAWVQVPIVFTLN